MRIDNMWPFGDLKNALSELRLDSVADVSELSIFEDEKIMLVCQIDELLDFFFIEIIQDINMRLQ